MIRSTAVALLLLPALAFAQVPLSTVPAFSTPESPLTIRREAMTGRPFTVAGARGVVLGVGDGTFEQWVLPIKVLSHLTIEANVEGYPVPIELNPSAATIAVSPDHTVITYAHVALTVRQTMFSPDRLSEAAANGTGAVVLFEVDSVRPVDLTFRFTPEMRPMWPERGFGTPSAEWVARGASGFYVLHTDYPALSGAVALPTAQPGILVPYQEKPQVYPSEFHLHVDPKRDRGRAFPLLVAVGETRETASTAALETKLRELDAHLPAMYAQHAARYAALEQELTTIETPDRALDDDVRWAALSIEQLKARARSGELGLVAGYFSSGDSARPGFGWFFGRDSLYTVDALDAVGDFALTRTELEFLIRRQRADGKIPHEYSQTAAELRDPDWTSLPYFYAAADATPLFLNAMLDYAQTSGDSDFLKQHRDAITRAWQFETTHDANGDGIYDNAQGTGWVESWPPGMPKQEIYLALVDQQASTAMAGLATLLGEPAMAQAAAERATKLGVTIEREYFLPATDSYAFSFNGAAGVGGESKTDRTATIYPALAWWHTGSRLAHAETSLRRWNGHDFATDWGMRDVAESDPLYDPLSYHQGSVWPLFTGWATMAEYHAGHPLAGYAHLMETAHQTTTQDLGAVTELLSGAFFTPFGRSTSHQLWSSAMVLTPVLRGLFGITVDALAGTVAVDPHLPADWDRASVRRLHVGRSVVDLAFERQGARLAMRLTNSSGPPIRLTESSLPLPAVEAMLPFEPPLPGARTTNPKVLSEAATPHTLTLAIEGLGGSTAHLRIRRNGPIENLHAQGGMLTAGGPGELDSLTVAFPPGDGYRDQTATLSW